MMQNQAGPELSAAAPGLHNSTHTLRGHEDAANSRREPVSQVIGRYRTLEVLGEGGMGVVYLAEQQSPFRRQVALKLIRFGLDSREVMARFESERQALALMNHPNIAGVIDAGSSEQGRPYFVMEYVPGIAITEYCDRNSLSVRERLELLVEVCAAVQHAHAHGIIHRDLKPSNILVTIRDGRPAPKIIDFGVAKAVSRKLTDLTLVTLHDQFVGTPAYMSPEQAEGCGPALDFRTDVYSLGVLLYELLVGTTPFDPLSLMSAGRTGIQRIIREVTPVKPSTRLSALTAAPEISHQRQADLRGLQRQLRGDLDWITMKAMEKDRTRRYACPADLAADLRRHLAGEPVEAGPPSIPYRIKKFVVKRARGVAVAGLVLVCLATAGYLYVKSARTSKALAYQTARRLFSEAQREAHCDPRDALKKYAQAYVYDPGLIDAQIERAFLLKRLNRTEEAIESADRIIRERPELAGPAHVLLAQIHRYRNPQRAEEHRKEAARLLTDDAYYRAMALAESDAAQAVELLTQRIEADSSDFDARWARTWRYYELKDYEAMREDAIRLTDLMRSSPSAWNALGVAQSRLGLPAEAVAGYIRAIRLAPDYAPGYINRAEAYIHQQLFQKALEDCHQALKLEPEFAEAHAIRAMCFAKLGKPDRSQMDLQRAVSLEPDSPVGYRVAAAIAIDSGQWDEAVNRASQAIERDPNDAVSYMNRAKARYEQGEYERALSDCEAALNLDDRAALAWLVRGAVCVELGRPDEALAALNRSIECGPFAEAYFHRGRGHRIQGEYASAMADFDRVIERAPELQDGYAGRGLTCMLAGDAGGAVRDFAHALKLEGRENVVYPLWTWEIKMALGKTQEAAQELARAAEAAANDWEKDIVGFYREDIAADALLAKAVTPQQRCEAYYHIGVRLWITGRPSDALVNFEKCRETNIRSFIEYELAGWHIAQLEADHAAEGSWREPPDQASAKEP